MISIIILWIAVILVGAVFAIPKTFMQTRLRRDLGMLILCIVFFTVVFIVMDIKMDIEW